ncbi:L-alanine-DL-glutamate epimerase [Caproiciproducens sp. NJN-50]|uniref:enolase C-terminal domain-like protein n=1 Tax=Caproiciproducens sp. NJN-50 TaxID=2507162 RepID=UPI000FFDFAF8|nr:enolase C-terminal domain-like protein [Caproiciproducens sp. NJN-50]QAT48902.1 L-alanine-DL-glutamate epimerase [Caproiciproducens sp. NJN-50]
MFDYQDKLTFSKAIYYNFNPIPLPRTFKDATGGFGNFAPLQGWIRIYDSEGCCGETFCSKGMVENVLPLILTGETRTYTEWYRYLYWCFRNFGFQSGQICDLGQFDLIMLDILARRKKQPLHRFLGAKKDWAAVYKGGGAIILEDQALVDDMLRYVEEGYKTVKFKVGSDWGKNMERDAHRMELVRKAVGDDIAVAVDGNQVWDVDGALKFADMIRPYRPAWFEEPVFSQDMNAIKELKERGINMKIAFGESMRNYYAFETYVEKGVDHLMPLVGRMGSVRELVAIRDLAKRNGLDFSSGGTTFVNAALGALYEENEMLEYHEPITYTLGECLEVKCEERDGRFYLPDIEGAPYRINLKKLEADGALESKKYFYSENAKLKFAVRGAY